MKLRSTLCCLLLTACASPPPQRTVIQQPVTTQKPVIAPAPPRPPPTDDSALSMKLVSEIAALNATFLREGGNERQLIAESVREAKDSMKDPASAQIRNVRVVPYESGKLVCGEINAKNSYGGYVGFSPFAASPVGVHFYRRDEFPPLERVKNKGLLIGCGGW